MPTRVTIDFETRSAADLRRVGSYEYSLHPSTSILCLAWAVDDEPVALWHPGFEGVQPPDDLAPLFEAIRQGALVEAHNKFFEHVIWKNIGVARLGWPEIPEAQWRCSLAKASAHALPKKLEKAAAALQLSQTKDMGGHRLMQKLSKPRKPTKHNPAVWHERPEELERLFEYCRQDVRTERELSRALRELSPLELEVWRLDQQINLRGVRIDRALCEKAIALGAEAEAAMHAELAAVTDEAVHSATERASMIEWLKSRGIKPPIKVRKGTDEEIETTESKSLVKLLATPALDPAVKRAIEIWIAVNKSSVKKYKAMLERANAQDDRVRETLAYHSASTGRFAGRGIQVQNFPRPPRAYKKTDQICADLLEYDYGALSVLYGSDQIMSLLSGALRGAICAAPGKVLAASDFSAVETRGAAWLAGDTELLDVFRKLDADPTANWDVYTWQASQILGRPVTKDDDYDRQAWGKVPTLACVYQGSGRALVTYADGMGLVIPIDTADEIVSGWRETRSPIVNCWWATERAAIEAVQRRHLKDRTVTQGKLKWKVVGRFLHTRLPSGRLLSYLDPELETREFKSKRTGRSYTKTILTFLGEDTYTRQWKRCSTYGGKLFENDVQAICRDLLVEALLRLAAAGYDLCMSVHDEAVAELLKMFGSAEEMNRLMSQVPAWAAGFPIASAGWRGVRYRK